MVNVHRGEVAFSIGGKRHALVLTLGALATLDEALGVEGLAGLAERLSAGRLSPGDTLAVLSAGLAGAGTPIETAALGRMIPAGDLAIATQAAADLLAASFGAANSSRPPPPQAET
jgi:Phage tail tube protein, GTA-gp10